MKKVIVFLLLINIFFGKLITASSHSDTDLFYRLVFNKKSYTKNITQVEFLILFGRLLSLTNDEVPNQFVVPLENTPKWAEKEVEIVQNKFGKLVPYYLDSFDPKESITKKDVSKLLYVYLDLDNPKLKLNSPIEYNLSFYKPEDGYKVMIDNEILPNTSRNFLTKLEASTALLKVFHMRKERLFGNKRKSPSSYANLANISILNEKEPKEEKVIYTNESVTSIKSNFGLSNSYIWRGMAQANTGDPAVYGGLDTALNENISLGTWISNVGFADNTTYEWDFYGSYSNSLTLFTELDYEMGLIYYAYPDSQSESSIDFSEGYISISKNNLNFSYYIMLSGPNNASIGSDTYLNISFTNNIIQDFEFFAGIGFYEGNIMISKSQTDYLVGISKNGFTYATLGVFESDKKPIMQVKYEWDVF